MIIIIAATNVDLDALNDLVRQYDIATDEAERRRIAEEVERLVGDKARSAVRQRLGNFGLSQDEIASLATETIDLALRGVGRVHLRRSDIVSEELVRQMTTTERGQRLLHLLSPGLQQALQAPYLKQDTENLLIRELNSLIGRDLAKDLGIPGSPASPSAIQRSIDNAQLLASAFPDAVNSVERPPMHFMGFLTKTVIPTLGQRVKKEKGNIPEEVLRTWRAIRPIVEDLRASSGGAMLSAEEVRQKWMQRMSERYGAALTWWIERMREVGRSFKLDHNSFADAKAILIDQGFDQKLWEGPKAQYHLPKDFLKPFSANAIERALAYQQGPATRPLPAQPATQSAPDIDTPDAPTWALEVGQQQGRGQDLYRAIVQSLYTDPESAERQIGELLAENASAETIESYIRKVEEQDSDLADFLRSSWQAIARQIDSRVSEALKDPGIVGQIARQFGYNSSQLAFMRNGIRILIFGRNAKRICRQGF